jgi:cytidine deaminase
MMKRLEIVSVFEQYDAISELPEKDRNLLMAAKKAAESAYAPYSNFHVGAAVLLENGVVVSGNNQENAAYPSGLCAERVAMFYAGAQYPGVPVKAVAITAFSPDFKITEPVGPCGACRQSMVEYENRYKTNIRVLLMDDNGKVIVTDTLKSYLPLLFSSENLKRKIS